MSAGGGFDAICGSRSALNGEDAKGRVVVSPGAGAATGRALGWRVGAFDCDAGALVCDADVIRNGRLFRGGRSSRLSGANHFGTRNQHVQAMIS